MFVLPKFSRPTVLRYTVLLALKLAFKFDKLVKNAVDKLNFMTLFVTLLSILDVIINDKLNCSGACSA